ncbi:PE family protein, partial [Mycobacterium lacus]
MSYVVAVPEIVGVAARDLAAIGSSLNAARALAAVPTTGVLAAGADEVSAAVASLFSGHAQGYQSLAAQAAVFHDRFVQALTAGAASYASAEAANASPLQALQQGALNLINAPTEALVGRPLIGDGANGAPGTGQAGGDGGILWGNGGNGGSGAIGQVGGNGGAAGLGRTGRRPAVGGKGLFLGDLRSGGSV